MKKVLILSGSPRKGGNSDSLCDEFMRGAADAGNQVEKIFIQDQNINFCMACWRCRKSGGVCVIKDDMAGILEKMNAADVIVMASPVHFYSISGQMKTLIDRCHAQSQMLWNKELYYIISAGANSKYAMQCALDCFHGFAACIPGAKERGHIFGGGENTPGAIKNHKNVMKEAYNMGRGV